MFDLDTCNYNKKKVAIYTRVSTEHEEQISAMANQKDWYSAILNIHPEWDVVQMYADEGVTGTAAYKRKAFMEMIRDAEAKKSESESEMDKDCEEALKQIVTKKYAEGLYGYEQVLCYGIAFFQKQARVRRLTE